jgi:hypothetical protein
MLIILAETSQSLTTFQGQVARFDNKGNFEVSCVCNVLANTITRSNETSMIQENPALWHALFGHLNYHSPDKLSIS